jgi:hypothetical protein
MRVRQAEWSNQSIQRSQAQWPLSTDFLAVATLCLIFGLQIMVLTQNASGSQAFSMVASEGMQSP